MFTQLGDRLQATFKDLTGRGRLSEENIKEALREVRIALLEADVALPVVRSFLDRVREKAVGQAVLGSLSPGQAVIKVVNDELVALMGAETAGLNLSVTPPAVILLAGLQGAGKTTTAGKLARFLKEREKKQVLLCSVDVYRPAAIEQLSQLAQQSGVGFVSEGTDPVSIAQHALSQARVRSDDVVIVDTAGRLHVDGEMMTELKAVHEAVDPIETVEEVQRSVDQEKARKISQKLKKGKGFDLEDFRDQLQEVEKMGGLGGLMEKIPGMASLPQAARAQMGGGETARLIAIVNSMTPGERAFPAVIKGSRKRRIAAGSGTQVQEVNRLLKQFAQMQKMMKKMKGKGGMSKLMAQMKGGGFPGGGPSMLQ